MAFSNLQRSLKDGLSIAIFFCVQLVRGCGTHVWWPFWCLKMKAYQDLKLYNAWTVQGFKPYQVFYSIWFYKNGFAKPFVTS